MPRLLRSATFKARALRRKSTPAEQMLWQMLRGRQVMLVKFRRQHPIGPFIVDFFCAEAGLVVEADGAPHFPKPQRDHRRDAWPAAAGLVVLRLPNQLILRHPDRALRRIRRCLSAIFRPPSPAAERGWG
jgi:very-short-patch-repair endonuclease